MKISNFNIDEPIKQKNLMEKESNKGINSVNKNNKINFLDFNCDSESKIIYFL